MLTVYNTHIFLFHTRAHTHVHGVCVCVFDFYTVQKHIRLFFVGTKHTFFITCCIFFHTHSLSVSVSFSLSNFFIAFVLYFVAILSSAFLKIKNTKPKPTKKNIYQQLFILSYVLLPSSIKTQTKKKIKEKNGCDNSFGLKLSTLKSKVLGIRFKRE